MTYPYALHFIYKLVFLVYKVSSRRKKELSGRSFNFIWFSCSHTVDYKAQVLTRLAVGDNLHSTEWKGSHFFRIVGLNTKL